MYITKFDYTDQLQSFLTKTYLIIYPSHVFVIVFLGEGKFTKMIIFKIWGKKRHLKEQLSR